MTYKPGWLIANDELTYNKGTQTLSMEKISLQSGVQINEVSVNEIINYTNNLIVFEDSAGNQAIGYIKEPDGAEALGAEIITNGDMELDSDWSDYITPTLNERSAEQVKSGTYSRKFSVDGQWEGIKSAVTFTLTAGKLYKYKNSIYGDGSNKAVIRAQRVFPTDSYFSPLSVDAAGYVWPASWTSETWYFSPLVTDTDYRVEVFSGNGITAGTWYVDNVSVKEVTHVGATGVHIVSTPGGSTRNWTSIDSSFDPNDVVSATMSRPLYVPSPTSKLSMVDGNAFALVENLNLSRYLGGRVIFEDSSGKQATGYIKEADAAEALGSELVTGWINHTTSPFETFIITGSTITQAANTVAHGICYSSEPTINQGELLKINFDYTLNDGPNVAFRVAGSNDLSQDISLSSNLTGTGTYIFYVFVITASGAVRIGFRTRNNGDLADFAVANFTAKKVTDVGTDGVHIVSAQGGSTHNWTLIDSGFDPNDIASVTVFDSTGSLLVISSPTTRLSTVNGNAFALIEEKDLASDSTSTLVISSAIRANGLSLSSDSFNLSSGDSTAAIVFDEPQPDINYAINLSLVNSGDNPPSIYSYIVTSKLVTGFTVLFSGEIDSDNYILEWIVEANPQIN